MGPDVSSLLSVSLALCLDPWKLGKERVTAGWGRDGRRVVDSRKLLDFVSLEVQSGNDTGIGNGK